MSNIATTIEQSKQLVRLGLDPKTADMFYFSYGMFRPMKLQVGKILEDVVTGKRQWAIPAWSLSALLEVMPKPDLYREVADCWVCATFFKEGSVRGFGKTAIEAACDTITKMFKQGLLIKKGGQDE